MRIHTVDHNRGRGGVAYSKTHYLHGRLPERPLCWLLGHNPVVHTYKSKYSGDMRWIECKRCLRRPLKINDRANSLARDGVNVNWEGLLASAAEGNWTGNDIGSHAQIVIGKPRPELSFRLHFGGRGSETPIDGHATILGNGIYWGLGPGTKIAEKLGPQRDLKFSIHNGSAFWCLWMDDSRGSREIPRWRQGSCSVNPLDYLFGRKRYWYEDVTSYTAMVTFTEGDTHEVQFKLQRMTLGRKGLPRFAKKGWSIDWTAPQGIPIYVNRDWKGNDVIGSSFTVTPPAAYEAGEQWDWLPEAVEKLREWVTREREENGWKPEVPA